MIIYLIGIDRDLVPIDLKSLNIHVRILLVWKEKLQEFLNRRINQIIYKEKYIKR